MKSLKTNFALIKPQLVNDDSTVRAWFTLKNAQFGNDREIPGLNLGFNTSEKKEVVAQNRLSVLSNLEINPEWIAYADQVHSNRVQVVSQGGIYPTTDGLVTVIPGLTLAIQVADCAAVLLWDSSNKIIGALHAGWRGAAGDIVPNGISKMKKQGANPNTMKAFVSPCISLKNFEIGQEVADQFPDDFVDSQNFDKPHLDLKGFLNYQLQEGGLEPSNIEISDECTIENTFDYFSYRREGPKSGRMMGLIQISNIE